MSINSKDVSTAFLDSLYRNEEISDPTIPPKDAVIVDGVMGKIGFNPIRLSEKKRTSKRVVKSATGNLS